MLNCRQALKTFHRTLQLALEKWFEFWQKEGTRAEVRSAHQRRDHFKPKIRLRIACEQHDEKSHTKIGTCKHAGRLTGSERQKHKSLREEALERFREEAQKRLREEAQETLNTPKKKKKKGLPSKEKKISVEDSSTNR